MEIGKTQKLTVSRQAKLGWFLKNEAGIEAFIDEEFVPDEIAVGDTLDVFVYNIDNGKLIATTEKPLVELDGYAALEVKKVTEFGAFLNWGITDRDLLVPTVFQPYEFQEGEFHVVYLMIAEKSGKLIGNGMIENLIDNKVVDYEPGDKVNLLVYDESDLGMKVIINQKHKGLIYHNEIFKEILIGDSLRGYIKKVREDNKIDVSIEKFGYRKVELNTTKLLDAIVQNNGILYLCDKSNPNEIYNELGISKKVFKKAVGALLKDRKIKVDNEECKIELID